MQLFEKIFLTCMYSLRNNMYNCMICFFKKISLCGENRRSKMSTYALYRLLPDCGFDVTG